MQILRDIFSLFRDAFQASMQDRVPRLAAALSFYTILSLSPTLVLVVAVAGSIVGQESIQQEIIFQVTTTLGSESAALVSDLIDNASQLGVGLFATVVSVILILFGASGAFMQLYDSLNFIWDVKPYEDRPGLVGFIIKRGIAIVMILAVGFILVASLLTNTILAAVTNEIEQLVPALHAFRGGVNLMVSLSIFTLIVALMFKYIPAVRVRWRDILPGAGVTALLFIVGENLISIYFSSSSVASVYGAAGSLVILLLWIYYSTQILFFGAELTYVYSQRYGAPIEPEPEEAHPRHQDSEVPAEAQ